MLSELDFVFSDLSVLIFAVSICGLVIEDQSAIRLVLLLEISLAATLGYTIALFDFSDITSFVFMAIILVIAAVESIILLCFIVVLYRLDSLADLIRAVPLQVQ